MTYVEKCCFVLPLRIGCILLGTTTFVLSLVCTILGIQLLALEELHPVEECVYVDMVTGLGFNPSSLKIVLSSGVVLLILLLIFSLSLLYGIWKDRTNFVLSYFFYGIFVVFMHMLVSLLLLIQGHWTMALGVLAVSIPYIHGLVVVYSAYEQMHRFKTLLSSRSTEELMEDFDDRINEDPRTVLRIEH